MSGDTACEVYNTCMCQGVGVESARVLVDGREQAITGPDGTYRLDSMRAGTYAVDVQTEHVFFDTAQVKITPSTPQLPDIIAARYGGLCVLLWQQYGLCHVRNKTGLHRKCTST